MIAVQSSEAICSSGVGHGHCCSRLTEEWGIGSTWPLRAFNTAEKIKKYREHQRGPRGSTATRIHHCCTDIGMFVDAVLLKLAIQCTFHLHEHTNLYTTAESVYLEAMMSNTSHLDVTQPSVTRYQEVVTIHQESRSISWVVRARFDAAFYCSRDFGAYKNHQFCTTSRTSQAHI